MEWLQFCWTELIQKEYLPSACKIKKVKYIKSYSVCWLIIIVHKENMKASATDIHYCWQYIKLQAGKKFKEKKSALLVQVAILVFSFLKNICA